MDIQAFVIFRNFIFRSGIAQLCHAYNILYLDFSNLAAALLEMIWPARPPGARPPGARPPGARPPGVRATVGSDYKTCNRL